MLIVKLGYKHINVCIEQTLLIIFNESYTKVLILLDYNIHNYFGTFIMKPSEVLLFQEYLSKLKIILY